MKHKRQRKNKQNILGKRQTWKRGMVDHGKAFPSVINTLFRDKGSHFKTTAAEVTTGPPVNSIIHTISLLKVITIIP